LYSIYGSAVPFLVGVPFKAVTIPGVLPSFDP